jgi:hypothetical protein
MNDKGFGGRVLRCAKGFLQIRHTPAPKETAQANHSMLNG